MSYLPHAVQFKVSNIPALPVLFFNVVAKCDAIFSFGILWI